MKKNSFLSKFILFILFLIIYIIIDALASSPLYCLDEDTQKQLMEKAKDINPAISGNENQILNLFYLNLPLAVFILLLLALLTYLNFVWRP